MKFKLTHTAAAVACAAALGFGSLANANTAAPTSATLIAKGSSGTMTPFLVDAQGRTLYTLSKENKAACDEACMKHWEPVVSESRPLGRDILPGLLKAEKNEQGVSQVSYGGLPLYRFDGDKQPGDMNGQGFADVGVMVSVLGTADKPEVAGEKVEATPELMAAGAKVFSSTCAACHGAEGQGAFGTKLEGFDRLANAPALLSTIIHGLNSMPALGGQFNDEQVAAVATYVRNSWGNKFGGVSAEQAKAAR
ncbi:c-type cytochrome [Advenella mimigardefordensis]|uniref:Putative cytochrome c n=1 Tax=Advenella mimigardefordensis (strain DSM 17166 / LMG 22922 / DPN7) TaxID=1247726 RepID=W0PA99_ADVMD|nr:c-type cytochrome [Advenella mimigardefordensis]AHG62335.1 putative cytochrome c [Advenella mimigardefordensis DPN7]